MIKYLAGTMSALFGGTLVLYAATTHAAELDLRVLIVAVGDAAQDEARGATERYLTSLGVPYEVLDSSVEDLDISRLVSGTRGRFNGIMLTDAETYLESGANGLDATEFALLHEYERSFGVREAILSGFPGDDTELGLDYGMQEIVAGEDFEGSWLGRAGGSEIFEYINTANALPTEGFAFEALPREASDTGPLVEPLLVDTDDPDYALISVLTYPDGRQVLLSSLSNAEFFLHTNVLAYEFLNFATSGLFVGARHHYLSVHNDDLFLADEVWNPATNSNFSEAQSAYRLTAPEVAVIANSQQRFREAHPGAPDVTIEFAFNGVGADLANDPLTAAIVTYAPEFGFINHTYQALQMDWLCPDGDNAGTCTRTDYLSAFDEISQNDLVWRSLGLPDADFALTALLTDSHSGLNDRQGTPDDTSDDIPFPEGFNPALGSAAEDLGVSVLASDASQIDQNVIQRVPGFDLVLLPRYPTALFYNTTTPTELVSEYNYTFHDSYVEEGLDPCEISDALCTTRSYEEILASEAEITLRHLLAAEPFPHYFHQTNLHVYDDSGNTLQFDWLEQVVTAYERWIKLPLLSPRFHELADIATRQVTAREAVPAGWVNTTTGEVSLSAGATASIEVTGIAGGKLSGGQSVRLVEVSTTPSVYSVDAALDR
jgi:hypothetical protein